MSSLGTVWRSGLRLSPLMMSTSRLMSSQTYQHFKAISVTQPSQNVFSVELNRPDKMNAMSQVMWEEIGEVFRSLDRDGECRVVLLSGAGKMFSSGIDLNDFTKLGSLVYGEDDLARKSINLYQFVREFQDCFTELQNCRKPVIGCIHSACVGGGVDLITATDIRLATNDAWFCVKEVDMGLAADVGTLQRLPKVIGNQSLVNELCLTARKLKSEEAERCGLVSRVFTDKETMMTSALELAKQIAAKSPVAVQGTKIHLNYSREHTVEEGLKNIATWNMAMLQSEDLMKSAMASMDKSSTERPEFENF